MVLKRVVVLGLVMAMGPWVLAKHEHREHGAHVHGTGDLSVAFDGNQGKLNFKAPSDSIYGFEFKPTKAADKAKMNKALDSFSEHIGEMVVFDSSLKCAWSKEKVEVSYEGQHSDTVAVFTVKCGKSPLGTQVTFNLQNFFPDLHAVTVQFLIGDLQKSMTVKRTSEVLSLTK